MLFTIDLVDMEEGSNSSLDTLDAKRCDEEWVHRYKQGKIQSYLFNVNAISHICPYWLKVKEENKLPFQTYMIVMRNNDRFIITDDDFSAITTQYKDILKEMDV